MIPIFDSKRQYSQIGEEAEKAVCEVMRSDVIFWDLMLKL